MSRSRLVPTLTAVATIAAVALSGCGSGEKPAGVKSPAALTARVSSSIPEGAELTDPVPWEVRVSGVRRNDVVSVQFLVDGNVKHTEHLIPYVFDGRGNLLLPGILGAGAHTFAVDVRLADGRRLTAASTARVSSKALGVPPEVLGNWIRAITASDVARTQAFRNPAFGEPLPVGTWTLRIGADGVARYIDPTSTHDVTVGQVRFGAKGRLVVGNEIPNFPGASKGGFCGDSVGDGIYTWSLRGAALLVRAVHDNQCADRNSFWNGRFTR
jgi:hypothetical protein